MERIIKIIVFSFLFIFLIAVTVIMIVASNNKYVTDNFYVVMENRSYIYEEGRKFSVTIYSDMDSSLITYQNENEYYLLLDDYESKLNNVSVNKYEGVKDKLYKFEFDLPKPNDELSSENAKLRISNSKYKVEFDIGTFCVINKANYELLSVDRLYGSFDNISGEKRLVGINIKFNQKFDYLTSFKLGKYGYGYLSKTMYNQSFDYNINITNYINNYSINKIEEDYTLGLAYNDLFIPITYKKNYILKDSYITLTLDGKDYYIDNFSYLVNELSPSDYPKTTSKGEITYARAWTCI